MDRFRDPDLNPLGTDIREELLARFGLFGLRLAIRLLVKGRSRRPLTSSNALLATSGITDLQRILADRFAGRSDSLKARSALAALRGVADELGRRGVPGANGLAADIERVESGSEQLALLRLLHLVLTGSVEVTPDERLEIDRLTGSAPSAARTGLERDAGRTRSGRRRWPGSSAGDGVQPAR